MTKQKVLINQLSDLAKKREAKLGVLSFRLKSSRRASITGPSLAAKINDVKAITPRRVSVSPKKQHAITDTGTKLIPTQMFQYGKQQAILWHPDNTPQRGVGFMPNYSRAVVAGPVIPDVHLTAARINSWLLEQRSSWPSQQKVMGGRAVDECVALGLNVGNNRFEWGHLLAFMFGGQDGVNPQVADNLLAMTAYANSEMLAIFESPIFNFILDNSSVDLYVRVSTQKYANSRVGHSVRMTVYSNNVNADNGISVTISCMTLRQPSMDYLAAMRQMLNEKFCPATQTPRITRAKSLNFST